MTEKKYQYWKKSMDICFKVFHCHQLSDRSFHFHGMQFPLCARCTGILLGLIIVGPVVSALFGVSIILSITLIFLMAVDGLLQYFNVLESNNFRRLFTGIGFGYGITSLIVFLVSVIINLFHKF